MGEDDERDARESSPQPGRRLTRGKVTGRRETGRKEKEQEIFICPKDIAKHYIQYRNHKIYYIQIDKKSGENIIYGLKIKSYKRRESPAKIKENVI